MIRANQTLIVIATLALGACAQVQPLVSHAHVGHALTAWHDTPQQRGLLVSARESAEKALRASAQTQRDGLSERQVREKLQHVALALNPEVLADHGDNRYGAVVSLEGALEHLEYAVQADDASANMVAAVADISAVGGSVLERFQRVFQTAWRARSLGGRELFDAAASAHNELSRAVNGFDENADGQIALLDTEAGLLQIESSLQLALSRERNPAYAPVARKYLFGLVRLPSGKWLFRPRNGTETAGAGSYDYTK